MAFELEGFCVVNGPDIIWGRDNRNFRSVVNRFDGVVGGPPCQEFSRARTQGESSQENMIPEFARIVEETKPKWWVMENVPNAPLPDLTPRYSNIANAYYFGSVQVRNRRITSNLPLRLEYAKELYPNPIPCVTATEFKGCATDSRRASRAFGRRLTLDEMKWAMGVEEVNLEALSKEYQYRVLGNSVPLPLGRVIAKAVKEFYEENR
jgi:DNA (cytosine-5)-methyltransferase 1